MRSGNYLIMSMDDEIDLNKLIYDLVRLKESKRTAKISIEQVSAALHDSRM